MIISLAIQSKGSASSEPRVGFTMGIEEWRVLEGSLALVKGHDHTLLVEDNQARRTVAGLRVGYTGPLSFQRTAEGLAAAVLAAEETEGWVRAHIGRNWAARVGALDQDGLVLLRQREQEDGEDLWHQGRENWQQGKEETRVKWGQKRAGKKREDKPIFWTMGEAREGLRSELCHMKHQPEMSLE